MKIEQIRPCKIANQESEPQNCKLTDLSCLCVKPIVYEVEVQLLTQFKLLFVIHCRTCMLKVVKWQKPQNTDTNYIKPQITKRKSLQRKGIKRALFT